MNPDELKSYRKEFKLTQSELAKDLCVTTRAVVSWEGGNRNMPRAIEKLFCLLYGIEFKNKGKLNHSDLTPDLFENIED